MNLAPLVAIPLLFLLLIIVLFHNYKLKEEIKRKDNLNKNQLKNCYRKEWENEQKELSNRIDLAEKDYELKASQYTADLKNLETILSEKEKRYNEINQDLNLYKEGKIKEIDDAITKYGERERLVIDNSIDNYRAIKTANFVSLLATYSDDIEDAKQERKKIKAELEEERAKRRTINDEILRQRAVDEQQDFYRIQLPEDDKPDIEILRNVASRLRRPDAINKVIWSNYYQKPLAELRKRLLPGGDYSGIYKITRIKTGEIYIGQTTSIDKRFQEHVKTALGCGTLTSTQLHRTMAEDGPENFTFEILEQTPKEKLRERESFYIDFYDSKTYGLNTVTGDKNK